MAEVRVKYAARVGDDHEDITHLGSDGWRLAVEDVIKSIESGANRFHVKVGDVRAELRVVGGKHLQAQLDDLWLDALLDLPGFPETWLSEPAGARITAVTTRR